MSVTRIMQIILLFLWVIVGIYFLISPLYPSKLVFACTWISLIAFIGLNLLNTRGKKR